MLTSTGSNTIELYLPPGANQTFQLNLRVQIRDTLRAVTRYELGSVFVQPDKEGLSAIADDTFWQDNNGSGIDSFRAKLTESEWGVRSQILMSLSKLMNDLNDKLIQTAIHGDHFFLLNSMSRSRMLDHFRRCTGRSDRRISIGCAASHSGRSNPVFSHISFEIRCSI